MIESRSYRCGRCGQPIASFGRTLGRVDGVRTWVGKCCKRESHRPELPASEKSTVAGSLMDRTLDKLAPLGEMQLKDFRRAVNEVAETKAQANGIINEMHARGLIERFVKVTPLALNRKRISRP